MSLHLASVCPSCKKAERSPERFFSYPIVDTIQKSPVLYGDGKSFLALGDSYTIGASVAESERFPAQTMAALELHGKSIPSLHYIGVSGWTTSRLENAINTENILDSFGIVTLLIGVNDQYQGQDVSGYRVRFKALLEKSIQLAGGRRNRVFVLSIPDYSVTPFASSYNRDAIRNAIDQFNVANKEISTSYGVNYTDITPISREAQQDMSLLAPDGLHPSGKMYKKWVDILEPKIREVLP